MKCMCDSRWGGAMSAPSTLQKEVIKKMATGGDHINFTFLAFYSATGSAFDVINVVNPDNTMNQVYRFNFKQV